MADGDNMSRHREERGVNDDSEVVRQELNSRTQEKTLWMA